MSGEKTTGNNQGNTNQGPQMNQGGQIPHPYPENNYNVQYQQHPQEMMMNLDPNQQQMMNMGGGYDMYGNMMGPNMGQNPNMQQNPQQGYGPPQGLDNQMMQGFSNMNLGMNNLIPGKKPRGGGYGDNSYGSRGRGGYNPRKDHRNENKGKESTEGKENTSGRDMALKCNPDLKQVNPTDFVVPEFARMFVIKSQSEDDVHKSIKYGIWASTKNGNEKLVSAWNEHGNKCKVFLFFSVNASGQFLGVAEMNQNVDVNKKFNAWAQENKWYGQFSVKWTFLKDIPNKEFRHITLENNEGKPVTNSRDCQEVPLLQGKTMLEIFKNHKSTTTIMDDFGYYDKRQQDMEAKRGLKSHSKKDE